MEAQSVLQNKWQNNQNNLYEHFLILHHYRWDNIVCVPKKKKKKKKKFSDLL